MDAFVSALYARAHVALSSLDLQWWIEVRPGAPGTRAHAGEVRLRALRPRVPESGRDREWIEYVVSLAHVFEASTEGIERVIAKKAVEAFKDKVSEA